MKLIRPQLATKENQYIDVKTYFKKYLQSYLRWMYEQNNDFMSALSTDEITNFFLNQICHPLWFQFYLKMVPFRVVVESSNYIEKYKKNASNMMVELPINLKKENKNLRPVQPCIRYKAATAKQSSDVAPIIKRYQLIKPDEITDVDVAILLEMVKKL